MTLLTSDGYEIRIESAFQVHDPHSGDVGGVLGEKISSNPVLIGLSSRAVIEARPSIDGDLQLELSGGTHVEVPADSEFEVWTVAGPGGVKIVSQAGGGLAVWD